MAKHYQYDVIIIGGGAAGLTLALHMSRKARVALITKCELTEGATRYAQGGVSAVLDKGDSHSAHIADTLDSGAGLCDEKVVRYAVEHAQAAIAWLVDCGVPFSREIQDTGSIEYHLSREGGHSHRRVIHAADATGLAIETTLERQVHAHPNIDVFEHHIAIDLITTSKLRLPGPPRCVGVYALDKPRRQVHTFSATVVVLASGGAGKAYLYTTNPDTATGDGIAMAWRAGCRIANMEFIQFHPTCLYHPRAKSFLITEAVRGEGGLLKLPDGTRFMDQFDARGELAPRDIVARAIDHELKRLGAHCVYLDISHRPADFVLQHFPTIYRRCLEFGIDITKQPIPVVPAAHYTCGGVMTDLQARTDVPGLYAIGETAFTGFHGANRMASNSLLECLVFGMTAAENINAQLTTATSLPDIPDWDESRVTDAREEVMLEHDWEELRRCMWDYVGIVRTHQRLMKAQRRIDLLNFEINDYYSNYRVTNDLIELRNLAIVADLITRSALQRKESRGLHYTLDFPQTNHAAPPLNTILVPPNYAGGN